MEKEDAKVLDQRLANLERSFAEQRQSFSGFQVFAISLALLLVVIAFPAAVGLVLGISVGLTALVLTLGLAGALILGSLKALIEKPTQAFYSLCSVLWGGLFIVVIYWVAFDGGWEARARLKDKVMAIEIQRCSESPVPKTSNRYYDCIQAARAKASGYAMFHPIEWYRESQSN